MLRGQWIALRVAYPRAPAVQTAVNDLDRGWRGSGLESEGHAEPGASEGRQDWGSHRVVTVHERRPP